ncbi:MAG: methyltransferase [Peptoniphilaceae bacterium]|nr:methyltransferase [Peptoniphilaceae bacterium]
MKYDYVPSTGYKMIHVNNSYSFGIDSIILSSFAKMKRGKNLIDIGAGSGILSLRCLNLYNLKKVFAIEIQKKKADLLNLNLKINNLNNIEVINKNLNSCFTLFKNNSIDYIITNPPYYKSNDNVKSESEEFLISKHEILMTISDIFNFSSKILKDNGKLFMIHKPERIYDIFTSCKNLMPKKIQFVQSRTDTKPEFVLIEFVKNAKNGLKFENTIIIYNGKEYTKEVLKFYE